MVFVPLSIKDANGHCTKIARNSLVGSANKIWLAASSACGGGVVKYIGRGVVRDCDVVVEKVTKGNRWLFDAVLVNSKSSAAAPGDDANADSGGGAPANTTGFGNDGMAVDAESKRKANAQNAVAYTEGVAAAAFKKARGQDGDSAARGPAAGKACG